MRKPISFSKYSIDISDPFCFNVPMKLINHRMNGVTAKWVLIYNIRRIWIARVLSETACRAEFFYGPDILKWSVPIYKDSCDFTSIDRRAVVFQLTEEEITSHILLENI